MRNDGINRMNHVSMADGKRMTVGFHRRGETTWMEGE